MKNDPSSNRQWDSSAWVLDHQSPPRATMPGPNTMTKKISAKIISNAGWKHLTNQSSQNNRHCAETLSPSSYFLVLAHNLPSEIGQ